MAKKVTQDDIILINRAYLECGSYAAAARKTGFSAGTVKKYIIENFGEAADIQKWSGELLPPSEVIISKDALSGKEWADLNELRKEILV